MYQSGEKDFEWFDATVTSEDDAKARFERYRVDQMRREQMGM